MVWKKPATTTFASASVSTALRYVLQLGAPYCRVHTTWHWASSFITIKSSAPIALGAPAAAPNDP